MNRQNFQTIPDLFRLANNLDFSPRDHVLAFSIVNPVGRGSEFKDNLVLTPSEYERVFQLVLGGLRGYKGEVLIKVPPAAIPPRYLQHLMQDERIKFLVSCSFPLLGILPDGTLSVCALTGADGGLVLGHLRKDSIADVVKRSIEPLRKDYESITLTGVCADCVFKNSCRGSCRAYAYSKFGSFTGPSSPVRRLGKGGDVSQHLPHLLSPAPAQPGRRGLEGTMKLDPNRYSAVQRWLVFVEPQHPVVRQLVEEAGVSPAPTQDAQRTLELLLSGCGPSAG